MLCKVLFCIIWLLSQFSIVSVWWWGSESGWVRPQPHFRTACSCSWTLQCTTELKLRTAIEDIALSDFQSRPLQSTTAVAVDFRVLWTIVRLKLFKHYQVPHTWSRVVVNLRILFLLPVWSCLNITMYHVLKTEELTVYSRTIRSIVKLKILRYNSPHLWNRIKNTLESFLQLLDWIDFIVTIFRILEFEFV